MLYPKVSTSRGIQELSGVWNFHLCEEGESEESWKDTPLQQAEPIAVPASYNDQKDVRAYRNHCGWAVYQRKICVPQFWQRQRVVLRFGAATHTAKVWLDGKLLCEHRGGFLPFETEVTEMLLCGKTALLTVAVDNRVDFSTLPVGNEKGTSFMGSDNPGIPSVEAAKANRAKQNLPNFDFFNYAGLNRPVLLYTTPKDYIADVSIVPEIDDQTAQVSYSVRTVGSGAVSVSILDAQGKEVAGAEGAVGIVQIAHPELWWPGKAYLYTARFTFGTDVYEQTFGLRTVKVEGTKFLINGKPFYFKGFGKHEDSAFHGRGTDVCLNVKDVNLMHWLGANSFRTSHYPYAEEMYDLCDREGIVIIDEVPAVGIGMGPACDPYETMHIRAHHEDVLREIVARDKNHPCVVMWSLGNEPDLDNFPESAYRYWHSLYELVHQIDPQNRPVTVVCCQNSYEKDITTRTMDVVCLNRYYGWYNLSGDLDAACSGLKMEMQFWAKQGKPVMFTEYGADAVAGIHEVVPEMFSEEFQAEYYQRENEVLDQFPFFIGEQVWNFADFATVQGIMRVDGNKKGLFTRERRPKTAAFYFKKRWHGIPDFGYKE